VVGAVVAVLAGSLLIGRQGQKTIEFTSFEPAPLTSEHGQETKPSLAPDGLDVAYLEQAEGAANYSVVVRNLSTGEKRTVTTGLGEENAVHWSPDGERLAITRFDGGTAKLAVVSARGGEVRDLASLQGADRVFNAMESLRVGWMSGGRAICYSDRDEAGEGFGLFVLDLDSGRRKRLTLAPGGIPGDVQCAPSPDGKSIAFVRQQTVSEGDVFLLDVATGQQRRLTRMNGHFVGLAWLPDSREVIAGCGVGTAGSSIWHISTEGVEPRRITGREVVAARPSVAKSPGGVRVVYEVRQRDMNVWRWTAEGGAQRVTDSHLQDHYPAISPLGELAWVSRRSGAPEIWEGGARGETPRRLTFLNGPYMDFPRWSPNGRYVAFASLRDGTRDIFVVDRETKAMVTVPGATSEEGRASFSRDGKTLYFRSDRTGAREIWRGSMERGGDPVRMTQGGGYEGFEDASGKWLYFVKEREKPGLWRMPVAGGAAQFIAQDVWEGRWAAGPDGIYALQRRPKGTTVERMDWLGAHTETVVALPAGKTVEAGLAVSADGKSIYWAQVDRLDTDLMAVLLR
jgi:Tol biopolymer transport system component